MSADEQDAAIVSEFFIAERECFKKLK